MQSKVHFIENYHSGVIGLEQEARQIKAFCQNEDLHFAGQVRNISVDFHALKILSQPAAQSGAGS